MATRTDTSVEVDYARLEEALLADELSQTVDVLSLQKANRKALETLVRQKTMVTKLFVEGWKMKQHLKDIASRDNATSVNFMDMDIIMNATDEHKTTGLTFNRFMACLAFTYYEQVASALDVKDLARNLIVPSLVRGLKVNKEVEGYRALCLAVPGSHFLPRMFFGRMKESNDSETAAKYAKLVLASTTICILVDFINYRKKPSSDDIHFEKFARDESRYTENKHTLTRVVGNFGESQYSKFLEDSEPLLKSHKLSSLLEYLGTLTVGKPESRREPRPTQARRSTEEENREFRPYLQGNWRVR